MPQEALIFEFLDIMDTHIQKQEAVLVHCLAGCGRTGTMLALFLCKQNYFEKDTVITDLRDMRPCSIETAAQENLVEKFCSHISKS